MSNGSLNSIKRKETVMSDRKPVPVNPQLPERLGSAQRLLSAWCTVPEPIIAALLAREAFDAVTLDMQHGAIDFAAMLRTIPMVVAAGKPALVRIPVKNYALASQALDAGAAAVIAPMINSAHDARLFAEAMKYPPIGQRSWGPHAALHLSGAPTPEAYFKAANGWSLALAMIETREALAVADDILAEPGIDGIFIGPADLSIGLSNGAMVDPFLPAVNDAIALLLSKAKAHGKKAGVHTTTGERAAEMLGQGFDLVSIASDTALLQSGVRMVLEACRG